MHSQVRASAAGGMAFTSPALQHLRWSSAPALPPGCLKKAAGAADLLLKIKLLPPDHTVSEEHLELKIKVGLKLFNIFKKQY